MTSFLRHRLWPAFALLIALTLITGVVYPAIVTAVAQLAFPRQANGSFVVTADGRTVGSSLIGQAFSDPKYFWGRPSAAGKGYDASSSAGSNLGPTDARLVGFVPGVNTVGLDGSKSATNPFASAADPFCVPTDPDGNAVLSPSGDTAYARNPDGSYACYANTIPERAIAYRKANGLADGATIPVDVITTSASGLDPDISPAAAETQVARVAKARNMSETDVRAAVARHTQEPLLGFLGEPSVNVLLLNLDLDGLLEK
jgi:potassium-transporting ATPase KdpC subunit